MLWIANGITLSLDALFLSRLESQRAEHWQTLLLRKDDDIAPSQTICHYQPYPTGDTGHYQPYPTDCKAAVIELLGKAAAIYSQRIQQFEGEKMGLRGSRCGVRKRTHYPSLKPPKYHALGVLSQVLFDGCVPKNVNNWDISSGESLSMNSWSPVLLGPQRFV
ncbi:hypothetical protein LguiA_030904 [Lonicera macranthoides]